MCAEGVRVCPNCGVLEQRWIANGRECVNLSPITGQCVDCLAAMSKEMPLAEQSSFGFDSRAAAAGDWGRE